MTSDPRNPNAARPEVLDPEVIEMLRDLGGEDEPELLAELVAVFLADAPQRLHDMQQGLAQGDFELLERAAHTLKSSAANLGARLLSEHARELEAAARARRGEGLTELASSCQHSFDEARQALNSLIG